MNDLAWLMIMIALCGGVAVAIWGSNWIPFTSEVTVYKVVCYEELKNGKCEGNGVSGYRKTFKAIESQQSVVVSYVGDHPSVYWMDNCVVKDKNNWKCTDGILGPESMLC